MEIWPCPQLPQPRFRAQDLHGLLRTTIQHDYTVPGLVVTASPIHRNVYKHLSAKMSKYISVIILLFNWNMRTTKNDSNLRLADTIPFHFEYALPPGESPTTHILC